MSIERLRREWINPHNGKADIQKRMWDSAAKQFSAHEIPDPKTNAFLKLVFEKAKPDSSMTALDIGCGCGSYSIALAPHIKNAVGVDISPEMIQYAQKSAKEHRVQADFRCLNWASADIEKNGFKKAFDIVFAHMTPAIADFATFDKMNECSNGLCFIAKPVKRHSSLQEHIFAEAGVSFDRGKGGAPADSLPFITEYLQDKGFKSESYYRSEVWTVEKSLEEMTEWMILWAKLRTELGPDQERAIASALQKEARNGIIVETTEATIATVCWSVQPLHAIM